MAEERDDGITYLPTGMVRLVLDDQEVMLRRPKLRELKALRELFQEHSDQNVMASHMAQAQVSAIDDAWRARDEQLEAAIDQATGDTRTELLQERARALAEARTEKRQITRALDPELEALRAAWLAEAVSTLGVKGDLPGDWEDLPAWCMDDTVAVNLLNHWTTVPSGSGPSR